MIDRDSPSRGGFARRLARAAWLFLLLGGTAEPSGAVHASQLSQDAPTRVTRAEIHDLISDHTRVPYLSSTVPDTRTVLAEADQHPDDPLGILTLYKNSTVDAADTDNWNREHAWPISYGGDREDDRCAFQYTDLHALFAGDPSYNSSRGNKFYDDCQAESSDALSAAIAQARSVAKAETHEGVDRYDVFDVALSKGGSAAGTGFSEEQVSRNVLAASLSKTSSALPVYGAWVGLLGGTLGIFTALANGYFMYRNRRRVEFYQLTANSYQEVWREHEVRWSKSYDGESPGPAVEGRPKRVLYIFEFTVRNEYPRDITVGRFSIDDWMFEDRYRPGMYGLKRDYRVFLLTDKSETSLESVWTIKSHESLGIRVEVVETADGPSWISSKSRYECSAPKSLFIEFISDLRLHRHRVRFGTPKTLHDEFTSVRQWGDLVPKSAFDVGIGSPRPQR